MENPGIRTDQITGVLSYLETIDWSEPWLCGLVGVHFLCFMLTFVAVAADSFILQASLFCVYLVPVYAMEYVNEWAAENYKLFSQQQYFDDKGLFISLVVSAPLLVNACMLIFFWLYQAYKMLGRLKVVRTKQRSTKTAVTEKPPPSEGEDKAKDSLSKKDD